MGNKDSMDNMDNMDNMDTYMDLLEERKGKDMGIVKYLP